MAIRSKVPLALGEAYMQDSMEGPMNRLYTLIVSVMLALSTTGVASSQIVGKANPTVLDAGSWLKVACTRASGDAWRLPNGTVIYPSDPLLRDGWTSSSWVGTPRGPDLSRFDQEAIASLGFTIGFWQHDLCPTSQHCKISPDQIRAKS